MQYIYLIHWKTVEAEERAEILKNAGYNVEYDQFTPAILKTLRENPPDAFVIDLTRLPSQGRDLAMMLRSHGKTNRIPIIFVGGDPEKIKLIQKLLPDTVYTSWNRISSSLKNTIGNPPVNPTKTKSAFDAYTGTPLTKKLGIKQGSNVVLVNAPENFEDTLGELPPGVMISKQKRVNGDLTIWFVTSRNELEKNIQRMGACIGHHGLWIAWPKKASGVKSDLSQAVVRKIGLTAGLVDYKVCAIDAIWSGSRFTRRKK